MMIDSSHFCSFRTALLYDSPKNGITHFVRNLVNQLILIQLGLIVSPLAVVVVQEFVISFAGVKNIRIQCA